MDKPLSKEWTAEELLCFQHAARAARVPLSALIRFVEGESQAQATAAQTGIVAVAERPLQTSQDDLVPSPPGHDGDGQTDTGPSIMDDMAWGKTTSRIANATWSLAYLLLVRYTPSPGLDGGTEGACSR
jgi:hypothetical protein